MILSMIIGLGVALFGFALQTSIAGVNRKIIARLQKRYGPKWYQEFIDFQIIKQAFSDTWMDI